MTGYGSAGGAFERVLFTVEIRGVNSRYLESSVRAPRFCNFAEDSIKKAIQAAVLRGKVELNVNVDSRGAGETTVEANMELAEAYIDAFRRVSQEFQIPNDFGTAALSRMPDIFVTTRTEPDRDGLLKSLLESVNAALGSFNAMRITEGEKLSGDIEDKLAELEALAARVKARSPDSVREYRERLIGRMAEFVETAGGAGIDESRLLTEAAIFADKVDVDEELTRLSSHIGQARRLLLAVDGVGRKLDFLIQELNREVNTIGSKCVDLEITRDTLEMKAILEKIREQCQNLE
jgi:uncharacterized protein (TIGR00255 family)